MDVNQTRFHLLLGQEDWTKGQYVRQRVDLEWDRKDLTLKPLLFRFPVKPGDVGLKPEARRGSVRAANGSWYWISQDEHEILVLGGDSQVRHYWSADDLKPVCESGSGDFIPKIPAPAIVPQTYRGLAVSLDQFLVAGTVNPGGLLIFDLHAGGTPLWIQWPIPFAPFDLVATPDGGVAVLEREVARYWRIDRYFRVFRPAGAPPLPAAESPLFKPSDGSPALGKQIPVEIAADMAFPINLDAPISIEALPDGSFLFLESDAVKGFSRFARYRCDKMLGPIQSLEKALDDQLEEALGPTAGILAHDMAFLPGGADRGRLFLAGVDGKQSFGFDLVLGKDEFLEGTPLLVKAYFPMRGYSGKALVASGVEVYYDLADRWYPLAAQPRCRFVPDGLLELGTFDGKERDCVWHRALLDARIPRGAGVIFESRAANDPDHLAHQPWIEEPRPYLRDSGSEIPWHRPFTPDQAAQEGRGSWEFLFQNAVGRYLQVRIAVFGNQRNTPRLRALRFYYPRFSYMRYLPTVFGEDESSAWFLDRYLANMEGIFTFLEGRIAGIETLFDGDAVPSEFIAWLAAWLGATLDPVWDEYRRRLFIRHAIALYRRRGTPGGLLRLIRLALDPCPGDHIFDDDESNDGLALHQFRIVEQFATRGPSAAAFGGLVAEPGLGWVSTELSWTPAQGAETLHERFREFLRNRHAGANAVETDLNVDAVWGAPPPAVYFPPLAPDSGARLDDWRLFLKKAIKFSYAEIGVAETGPFRRFLAEIYGSIGKLNSAYGLTAATGYSGFDQVELPATLPVARALTDWIGFASLYQPLSRAAHRFTVLVPIQPDTPDPAARLAIVTRIVAQEKPAHTVYQVKPFWALFRVGEARLGLDSLLGPGNRFVTMILGKTHLAEGYLGSLPPWNLPHRFVTGRDSLDSVI